MFPIRNCSVEFAIMRGLLLVIFGTLEAKIGWFRQAEPTITIDVTTTWALTTSKIFISDLYSLNNIARVIHTYIAFPLVF